jgi:predicted ATPase
MLAAYAEILADAERIKDALAILDEALDVASHTGMHHYNAEIFRLKGELLFQMTQEKMGIMSDTSWYLEIESCFEQAIETARQQEAKSLELRATTSFAKFLLFQNRNGEAQERLKTIYQWFTEGYKTPDLQEACKFLNRLS